MYKIYKRRRILFVLISSGQPTIDYEPHVINLRSATE